MEDDFKILEVEYLNNHWSNWILEQISSVALLSPACFLLKWTSNNFLFFDSKKLYSALLFWKINVKFDVYHAYFFKQQSIALSQFRSFL
jgi:hypothetical protein